MTKRKTKKEIKAEVKNEYPSKIFKDFYDAVSKLEYVETKPTTIENEIVLKVGGKFYGYLHPCKSYLFGIQRNINNHWVTERIETLEQANKLIHKLAEYKDNQAMIQNLKGLGVL